MEISNSARGPWVMDFAEGSRELRDLLGGKGANVAEMTRVLGAERVPAGFTITTEACVAYMQGDGVFPADLEEQVAGALERLEASAGRCLGDVEDPLLVSVRSGARESMPGMLDTVLNLGLNDETVIGLANRSGSERFAWDSYRRFAQMFGNVVLGVAGERFEQAIAAAKAARGVRLDTELDAEALRELTAEFQSFYEFPQDPREQLSSAIRAVFDSWQGERAVAYRRINRIPDHWGTAVNVQQMVFGNLGESSGSGVAFSRDELTGAPEPSGDFLANAQGEDVVSGVRTPRDIRELRPWLPEVHEQLMEILARLERHYGDMQDTEFIRAGGPAVHAADAQCQAPCPGGRALCGGRRVRGTARQAPGDRHDRPRSPRCAPAPDIRSERGLRGARPRCGRLAGRRQGRDRPQRRRGGAGGGRGSRGDPRALVHRGG